jgi:hypothetical protein
VVQRYPTGQCLELQLEHEGRWLRVRDPAFGPREAGSAGLGLPGLRHCWTPASIYARYFTLELDRQGTRRTTRGRNRGLSASCDACCGAIRCSICSL